MTNIMKEVHTLISHDALLKKHLQQRILNHRALARRFHRCLEQRGKNASLDAIISAIRRYEFPPQDVFSIAEESLSNSKVASKTGLVVLQLGKSGDLPSALSKAISQIDYRKGEVIRLMQGEESAKILIDKHNLEMVRSCFKGNSIINVQKGVGEVSVVLPEKAQNSPGVTSIFASALAVNNINIIEVMSCLPEFIWVFKEEDLLKAHKIIFDLCLPQKSKLIHYGVRIPH